MDVRDVRDGCATMSGASDRGTRRLVVKVAADPHVHRFSLPMDNVQWRQARQALLAILGKAAANTALTYVDDEGDAVRVTCASEFQDAVLQLQAAGQRVLRFRAAPAATPAFVPDSPPPPPIPPRACGSAHGRGGTLASGSQVTPVPAPVTSTAARARRTPRDVPHREAQPRRQLKQATPSDEANGDDDDDAWVIVTRPTSGSTNAASGTSQTRAPWRLLKQKQSKWAGRGWGGFQRRPAEADADYVPVASRGAYAPPNPQQRSQSAAANQYIPRALSRVGVPHRAVPDYHPRFAAQLGRGAADTGSGRVSQRSACSFQPSFVAADSYVPAVSSSVAAQAAAVATAGSQPGPGHDAAVRAASQTNDSGTSWASPTAIAARAAAAARQVLERTASFKSSDGRQAYVPASVTADDYVPAVHRASWRPTV